LHVVTTACFATFDLANDTELHYCKDVDTIQNEPMTKARKPITLRTLRKNQRDRGILYKIIRARLGLTQHAMARLMGCSRDSIAAREGSKRLYTAAELLALKDISGMGDSEWLELLREIAK